MSKFASNWVTVCIGLVAVAWGGGSAWIFDPGPFEQDVDSWAVKITNSYPNRLSVIELVRDPSLWKGPIIPTLYHASYVVYPSLYSPIVFNVLCFGLAAMLLHRLFVAGGLHPLAATLGVLGWVVYPPFRYLFAMYFAEPVIALLSTVLLVVIVRLPNWTWLAGLLAGVLLLGRPPFLIVIGLIPLVMFAHGRRRQAVLFVLGTATTFLPWGVRNYLVTGTFVPFTVEGGQTLFHGSYLPFDNVHWQEFKVDPAVAALVQAAPAEPIARMKYLAGLAKNQVLENPAGQIVRSIRKAQRFWMDVPADSFVPMRNTGIAAAVILPLAVIGVIRNRHLPIVTWMVVWILGLWAMHSIVFGLHRYSYPVFPLATVLAASAVWRGGDSKQPADSLTAG